MFVECVEGEKDGVRKTESLGVAAALPLGHSSGLATHRRLLFPINTAHLHHRFELYDTDSYVKLSMSTNPLTITIAKSLNTGLRLVGINAVALTAFWIFSWLIACVLTIIYRPWESTTPLHYRDFQRLKQPWELAGSTVGVILLVIYLMRYSYVSRVVATRSSLYPYYIANMELIVSSRSFEFSREPTVAELIAVEDENINEDLQPSLNEEPLIPPNEHLPPGPNEHPLYQQPLPLFNEEPLLPLPNIGQQELRWSAQALGELPTVPGYDGDAVFRTKQRTTPRHGKTSALRHGQPHVKKHGQILVSGQDRTP